MLQMKFARNSNVMPHNITILLVKMLTDKVSSKAMVETAIPAISTPIEPNELLTTGRPRVIFDSVKSKR